jgi:hypothetical protein
VEQFLTKHQDLITGNISVFDRIIFKGYLPFTFPAAAEKFLSRWDVPLRDFKEFTTKQTMLLKAHAQKLAQQANRPYEHLHDAVRKEEYARNIADRDQVSDGLICVLACNEENHTFGLRYGDKRPFLTKKSPRCLTLYYYFFDRYFGLMHVRLCTWMPFTIQIYLNGHEWLARQMTAKNIPFTQRENAFTTISDCVQAQRLADKLQTLPWEKILHAFARRVNPLLRTILVGMEYYWVIAQAEYATDIMFCNGDSLSQLYTKWQKHAAVCFQAEDIMRFMGRKLHGKFNGDITTDIKVRPSVTRIKHFVRGNWIKMYNKHGIVLRIETVINRPGEFRMFKIGRGKKPGSYQPVRKRITNMARYALLGLRANRAYLDALSPVDDPSVAYRELKRLCEPVKKGNKRVRPLNPLRECDRRLFEAVVRGEHHLHGFKSNEIGALIGIVYDKDPVVRKKQCAKMNRTLGILRGHSLITRHGRSRRYRVTDLGIRHMNAAISLYTESLPAIVKIAA